MKKMFAALAVLGIRRTEPIDYVLSGEVVLVTEAGEEYFAPATALASGARRSGNHHVS